MTTKAISLIGLIFPTIIMAGCSGIVPGAGSAPEVASESQQTQSVAPTVRAQTATETEANPLSASPEHAAPTEETMAVAEAEEQENAVEVTQVEPENGLAEAAEQPEARLDSIPQPVNELADEEYSWSQLLPRDGIFPVYDPEFAPADQAPYDDDELVIGVEINGQAKAYAIGPLNGREMVNDVVGGVPVLVTW